MEIEVPEVYKPCFSDFGTEECRKALWYSPRTSWKSSGLGRLIEIYYELFPEYDVCVGVDSLTNAGDGVLSEFRAFIESEGLNDGGEWVFSPRVIYHKAHRNQIRAYAVQTNELTNVNVTKSKKLVRPVSLFVMDEVQKLHGLDILLNCLSTFLRQMKAGHSKVILAGNPDRKARWFKDFCSSKLSDPSWTVLMPTYECIREWIPRALIDEIEDLKVHDSISYRQIYLGDLDVAGWDSVFHSFRESEHYIPRQYFIEHDVELGAGALISGIVIGVDDAESRDAIAAEAITVHYNGMMRVQEGMYVSCRELTEKPALTERCKMVIDYLDYIQAHFNPDRLFPIIMSFDCASGMFRQMCVLMKTDVNFMRWRKVSLFAYTDKQDKERQLDLVNAAIGNGVLTIVNVDAYSPQYSNRHLVEELHSLRLLENGKIDPTIPNDTTDALQYAAMTVLANPFSLTFPARRKRYENDYSASAVIDRMRADNPKGEI